MEIWKDIPGYEGCYQASSEGRVRSLDRKMMVTDRLGRTYSTSRAGRFLRPHKSKNHGYYEVALSKCDRKKTRTVHSLVLEAFVGPCPAEQNIRHLDLDKLNNVLTNLCYGTLSENWMDNVTPERAHTNGKLTVAEAEELKRRVLNGENQTALSKEYGVSQALVSKIKLGEAWHWLERYHSTTRPTATST